MPTISPTPPQSPKDKVLAVCRVTCNLISRSLPWLCMLLPVAILFSQMRTHLVNIPYLDDFMFQPMFEKATHGFLWSMAKDDAHLTLHDFFLVQMEHRMAFVRAVIMLRHHFSPADITPENWFTLVLLIITAVNVGILLKKTAGSPFRAWWPVMALASFAIFSPVQYQVVLWAMMFQVATPACALSITLVTLMSTRLPLGVKWLVGVIAALCATESFASGILVWLLPLPVMIWGIGLPKGKSRWIYMGVWLAAFFVTMALYFHDLHNEVDGAFAYKQEDVKTMDRNVGAVLKDPSKAISFILHLVGGSLGRGLPVPSMTMSYIMGLVSVLALVAFSLIWVFKFKDIDLRQRLIPWICFGYYSVGTGAMVAMGRIWATSTGDNALSPRYTIHTVPLTVALVAMGWIVARFYSERLPEKASDIRRVATGIFVAVAALHLPSWLHGLAMMDTWESSRLRMSASTMFFKEHRVDVQGLIAGNKQRARALDDAGLLPFKMTQSNMLKQFRMNDSALSESTAVLKSLSINTHDRLCTAEGFACLRKRHRVADAVLLTHKNHDGEWVISVVAQVEAMPLFLADSLGRDLHKQAIHFPGDMVEGEGVSGFSSEFSLDQLPKESDLEVMAWAFDFREMTSYPMAGRYRVDTINGIVRRTDKQQAAGQASEH